MVICLEQMTCMWSSYCRGHPIISASVKSRMVYPELPSLSWKSKRAIKGVMYCNKVPVARNC